MNYKKNDIITFCNYLDDEPKDHKLGIILRVFPSKNKYKILHIDDEPDSIDNFSHYYFSNYSDMYSAQFVLGHSMVQPKRRPKKN